MADGWRWIGRRLLAANKWVFRIASGEWIVDWQGNGGTQIAYRAAWAGTALYAGGILMMNWFDPGRSWCPSRIELGLQVAKSIPWLGTTCGAAYVAFYSRFASQWQYAASVYNDIKEAECVPRDDKAEPLALAEWKAAFIEDCDELYLARHASFASTVARWGRTEAVRDAFDDAVPGGIERLERLVCCADKRNRQIAAKHAIVQRCKGCRATSAHERTLPATEARRP